MTTRLLLEGTDLGELVAHVRETFGPRARIVQAERIRSGGFAGFFATERFEVTVDVPDEPEAAPKKFARRPQRAIAPAPAPAGPTAPAPTGIEALLAAADRDDVGPGHDEAPRDPRTAAALPPPADPAPTSVSTGSESFADVLRQVRSLVGTGPEVVDPPTTATDEPAARTASAPPAPPRAPEVPAPGSPQLRAELARLGVPATVLDSGPVTLSAVLGRIPTAPERPRGPGTVLAVVGTGDDAVLVARSLAARWHLPPAAVVELDAPAAPGAAAAVRDPAAPRVLALRVGPEARDRTLAAALLRDVRPDQAWVVVDARTKPADAAAWVGAVGALRRVDALAVHGLLDTTAPGTVLELDLPVAWVDGLPASRLLWAAALGQELDAALGGA
ncbi:hypothetical protein [Cellulomonas oligotrophica]|uniref:Uncharacterized protein n=1 Tax=Cellulomonas oligotrophica TaxID=931536 RepID=A0A7Y9FHD4_9CELL|nr:hypothetical protein [Cellulomonas oligotrophica]NYD87269.1 hypothetical protein [Cellulomonas oligotrophica]GIG34051.1 hypothetical protein Col01nite_32100 [Cellulomonas oligotrophica]